MHVKTVDTRTHSLLYRRKNKAFGLGMYDLRVLHKFRGKKRTTLLIQHQYLSFHETCYEIDHLTIQSRTLGKIFDSSALDPSQIR